MQVLYPQYRDELIKLVDEDQLEIRGHYQKLDAAANDDERAALEHTLDAHCHARAERMLEILKIIEEPSITNIGKKGSEYVSVLALHSYIDVMQTALAAYKKVYERDPRDVNQESIVSLTDRIMIFEQRRQLYGSNWSVDKNGRFFMIPVEDFAHMNERRAVFGLGPRMKPRNLAIGQEEYPLGRGEATADDQKELTDEEYDDFTRRFIRP